MKVGYYPGCSLHGTAKEYDESTRLVCSALNIDLQELPDWCCCGASSAHSINNKLSLELPAWNIAIASKMGLDIVIPCAACFNRLKTTEDILKNNKEKKEAIENIIGFKYKGNIKIFHLLDYITNKIGLDTVKKKIVRPLNEFKVANYYGCLIVRPNDITQCDYDEYPEQLDLLMEAIGCKSTKWSYKNECCGGGLALVKGKIVENLSDRLITKAKLTGAEAVVTACPLCQANLEMRQKQGFPVFYFTELLAVSLGIKEIAECLDKHIVDARSTVTKYL